MKTKTKAGRITALFLVAMVALAGTSVGYAHWSQTIYIEGMAETGSFGIGFWEVLCTEVSEIDDKDIGSINCEMVDQKGEKYEPFTGEMKPVYEKIVFTIDNAYPCYTVHIVHTVVNFGTIPAIVTTYDMSDPTGELNFEWTTPPPASPAYGHFWKDFDGDGVLDPDDEEVINVKIVNLIGEQLDPCTEEKGEIDFHVKQPAEQGHVYHIQAEMHGIQWNEA